MPKAKPFSLSGMVDTDVEEDTLDHEALPTPDSNQENMAPAKKKGRPKATAKRFTKAKRLSGGSGTTKTAPAPKSKAGAKRGPLKGKKEDGQNSDDEQEDKAAAQSDVDATTDELNAPRRATKRKAQETEHERPAKAHAKERSVALVNDGEFQYTPTGNRETKAKGRAGRRNIGTTVQLSSVEPSHTRVIPDTQQDDVSVMQEPVDDEDVHAPQSAYRRSNNATLSSRQRQPPPSRRRAPSASDTERAAGEPALRRRLGEMTRKYENIDQKYQVLRDTRMTEAESNYEKLRKQSEINTKAAQDLIASLKKEITTQKAIAQESRLFQEQINSRDADLAKTQSLADQLSTSLAEAQNENRALQAKLATHRTNAVATDVPGNRTPGNAITSRGLPQNRPAAVGGADTIHAAQIAQLKEDLYSDLTGLILRGVDIGTEADTYDCIQTGRNGTLHFKLAVAKDSDDTYENTEFQYTPRLDTNRDRDLIPILPDYLADEITFSRTNGAMFYGRVVETLTKRKTEAQ